MIRKKKSKLDSKDVDERKKERMVTSLGEGHMLGFWF